MAKRKTHEEFVAEMAIKNPDIEILEKYIDNATPILCRCRIDGHEWNVRPGNLISGRGCPKCKYRKLHNKYSKTHEKFVKELNNQNPNIEVIGKYINADTKILLRCKIDGYEWMARPDRCLRGNGCPECAGNKRRTYAEFLEELYEANPKIEAIGEYINYNANIRFRCKIDNHEWEATPNNVITNGTGCPVCGIKKRAKTRTKPHDIFIQELKEVNPNVNVLEKYKGSKTKLLCKCSIDEYEWKITPSDLLSGYGCPKCRASKGELLIEKYLKENFINFKPQYKFKDCKYKSQLLFDFYLPKLNTVIEYDGRQHFIPIEFFGGENAFKQRKVRDNIKDNYCKKKGIKLIRIPYTEEDIHKYLDEQLNINELQLSIL